MDSLQTYLLAAARASATVRIIYHGGSQPGTRRDIVPLVVSDDLVVADDRATDSLRSFRLEMVELFDPGTAAESYDPAREPVPDVELTIPETFEPARAELTALGWHVEISDHQVTLHRYFKNGKPRKAAEVSLTYAPMTVDMFDDGDGLGMQTVERPSKRPFAVSGSGLKTTVTFSKLGRAAVTFWTRAREHAPLKPEIA